jgi:hypothetical protein
MSGKRAVRETISGYVNRDDGRLHVVYERHTDEVVSEVRVEAAEALRELREQLDKIKDARAAEESTVVITIRGTPTRMSADKAFELVGGLVRALEVDAA